MLFAIDKSGNKVHIDSAKRSEDYFCPCCNDKLLLKLGNLRIHHFSHSNKATCSDSWHYDMSEWHHNWQNKFPKECQEVVKSLYNQKHRADILLENEKVVIEFQHSTLSKDEFNNRNLFYNKLGYKVIWVFDVEEPYLNGQIGNYEYNFWNWDRPKKTFEHFVFRKNNIEIFLQLEDDYLIKVTNSSYDNGFSKFATDGYRYYEKSFVNISDATIKTEVPFSKLFDSLIELYSKDHTTYFFGCPISSTHICANCNIDIPKSSYDNIMPCMNCEFNHNYYSKNIICKKRFLDLNLNPNTIVRIEAYDENDFISRISYISNSNRVYADLATFKQNISKSVFDLWDNKYSIATFRNIVTGKYIRITKNPREQYKKYRKVYGYFSSEKYSFPNYSCELYGLDKPEWICEWSKLKNISK